MGSFVGGHGDRGLCSACLEKEYSSFRHACVHELMDLNGRWLKYFNIGNWPRWDYQLESSTLTFSEADRAKVVADIEVVGSVHGGEWEWAWGNKSLPSQCRTRMQAVLEFGRQKEWEELTSLFLKSHEHLGWELTAVTAHLLQAQGAYRCPDEDVPGNFLYVVALDTRFVN